MPPSNPRMRPVQTREDQEPAVPREPTMSELAQVLSELKVLGVTLDHVKATGVATRSELKETSDSFRLELKEARAEVKQNAADFKTEMKAFEVRMRGVEDKATTVKGMWLAVVVVSSMLGIIGTVLGIIIAASRLGGHG